MSTAYQVLHVKSVASYSVSSKEASNATGACYVTAKNTRAWLKMVLLLRALVIGESGLPSQNSKQQDPCRYSATARIGPHEQTLSG